MNNFDWIVTVAMGSLLASGIVLEKVGVIEIWVAISLLLVLQYMVTRLVLRSSAISKLVKAEPRILLHNGELLHEAMRVERVTETEIYAAIRSKGLGSIEQVEAVILETDATLSVLPKH